MKSLLLASAVAASMFTPGAHSGEVVDAMVRPAISTQLGQHSFMLGISQVGDRIISVGERGIILTSDDGKSWKQMAVPVSVTLTAVRFADEQNGFAIGHAGTVLVTNDGGASWTVKLDGYEVAKIIHEAAKATGDKYAIAAGERLVDDGPDKPLLDLLVLSKDELIVTGAYGIALRSTDAGETWQSIVESLENPGGMHIYAIRKEGERIVMAGEMGMAWLSTDAGVSFELLTTPYEGSFFTAELTGTATIVLAGLRGNVWKSDNNGIDWVQLKSPVPATVTASAKSVDDQIMMVNKAGMVMELQGNSLVPVSGKPFPPLNNLLLTKNGDLIVASMRGLMSVESGDLK